MTESINPTPSPTVMPGHLPGTEPETPDEERPPRTMEWYEEEVRKLRKESANYRTKLRDAEATIEEAAAQLGAMRSVEIERLAAEHLKDPSDVWRAHADPAAFLDDEFGTVDPAKVAEAAQSLTEACTCAAATTNTRQGQHHDHMGRRHHPRQPQSPHRHTRTRQLRMPVAATRMHTAGSNSHHRQRPTTKRLPPLHRQPTASRAEGQAHSPQESSRPNNIPDRDMNYHRTRRSWVTVTPEDRPAHGKARHGSTNPEQEEPDEHQPTPTSARPGHRPAAQLTHPQGISAGQVGVPGPPVNPRRRPNRHSVSGSVRVTEKRGTLAELRFHNSPITDRTLGVPFGTGGLCW